MNQVLLCGALIVTLSMGIRHGFGLWLQPITMERGWTRETFALALAIQNLAWGLAGPLAGMLAGLALIVPAVWLARRHHMGQLEAHLPCPPFWRSLREAAWGRGRRLRRNLLLNRFT